MRDLLQVVRNCDRGKGASYLAEDGVAASQAPLDSGLATFVVLLRFLGKPADAAQLQPRRQ
jgi:hypothetical protein